jgi:hypothetical protein
MPEQAPATPITVENPMELIDAKAADFQEQERQRLAAEEAARVAAAQEEMTTNWADHKNVSSVKGFKYGQHLLEEKEATSPSNANGATPAEHPDDWYNKTLGEQKGADYGSMSLRELANRQAQAELDDDKTTAYDIQEFVLSRLEDVVKKADDARTRNEAVANAYTDGEGAKPISIAPQGREMTAADKWLARVELIKEEYKQEKQGGQVERSTPTAEPKRETDDIDESEFGTAGPRPVKSAVPTSRPERATVAEEPPEDDGLSESVTRIPRIAKDPDYEYGLYKYVRNLKPHELPAEDEPEQGPPPEDEQTEMVIPEPTTEQDNVLEGDETTAEEKSGGVRRWAAARARKLWNAFNGETSNGSRRAVVGERIMRLIGKGSPFPSFELGIDPAITRFNNAGRWSTAAERVRALRAASAAGALATALNVIGPRLDKFSELGVEDMLNPEQGEVRVQTT